MVTINKTRLLVKERNMTYTKENILSAIEATLIYPPHERHVLPREEKLHRTAATTTTVIKKQEFCHKSDQDKRISHN